MPKPIVAVFDTKPYDRDSFAGAARAHEIEWQFHAFRLEKATASSAQGAMSACIFVNDRADADALATLAECGVRHIALRCAGFNNLDMAAAGQRGLCVTRVPSYSPHAVAEHTLALLLSLNRRIHRAFNRVRELNFGLSGLVGFDLHGKTAGVLGTGRTGALVAQILRGFGMHVVAYDPYPNADWAAQYGVEYTDLETVFRRSDICTLHVPLTPETHHIINAQSLAWMKPGAVLVNVSRGALVDTSALIQSLKAGRLGGVALDVYEEEEGIFFEDLSGQVLQDDELARLLTFPNVLITSHQAFLTREALAEIARVTVENILRTHEGQPPLETTSLKG
jgi:D-lactate dehydrogenase